MTETEEVLRGAEAERLLNSEIYKEAISRVREGIVRAMVDSPLGDDKTHNRLVIALQLLNKIETNIREVAQTGQLAKLSIKTGLVEGFKQRIGR